MNNSVGSITAGILTVFMFVGMVGCQHDSGDYTDKPYIEADSQIEAGRYLTILGGCNDCHTPGYLMKEGEVPEEQWLTGSKIGWRGPWGTTYAQNLRLRVQEIPADKFVEMLHTRKKMPPMPWFNVEHMSEKDARAIYAYIKSLGPKGEPVPNNVPPDKEPKTPYFSLIPKNMPEKPAGGDKKSDR